MTKQEESKDQTYLTDMVDDGENHQRLVLRCCRLGMRRRNFCSQFHCCRYQSVKVTPNISEIYKYLLEKQQNNYSPIFDLPTPLSADALTSKNASNIIIGSGCEPDVYLDGYDKKILGISEDLQCPQNPVNLTKPNKPLRVNLK